mmetsp:Transcript_17394/g.26811  ORF Transcript_17394/g.26811 Transcript_17394/m.26811 type:complete len:86 (-) Transcript_17394:3-260(-)
MQIRASSIDPRTQIKLEKPLISKANSNAIDEIVSSGTSNNKRRPSSRLSSIKHIATLQELPMEPLKGKKTKKSRNFASPNKEFID